MRKVVKVRLFQINYVKCYYIVFWKELLGDAAGKKSKRDRSVLDCENASVSSMSFSLASA